MSSRAGSHERSISLEGQTHSDELNGRDAGRPRPYRSKKKPPYSPCSFVYHAGTNTDSSRCDACRRRRIACQRDDESSACALCRHRGKDCTFLSKPQRRPRPQPTAVPNQARQSSHGDDLVLSVEPSRSHSTSGSPLALEPAVKSTTSMPGWTCLLSGLSGDQNPHLLRHLAFDDSDMFGDRRWMVWRVDPRLRGAAYLTVRDK